jgi:MarR family transcriptional regulator, organic hydroperoxide resistance regulator
MKLAPDVAAVFRDYPRIYLSCHRRHVRDPQDGSVLSSHQVSILDHLDPVHATTLSALARHLGVTASTMSIAVDRLVKLGYVTRELDEADRRRVRLRLTPSGVRMCSANSVLEPDLVAQMLDQLPRQERRDALRGLALLAGAALSAQRARSEARTSARSG